MSRGESRTQFWHGYRVTLRISILLLIAAGLGKLLDLGLVELNHRGVVPSSVRPHAHPLP